MPAPVWNNPLLTLRAPEWVAAFYLFLLHFVWEMLQTPFFADMAAMAHWPATLFCLSATLGDVVIGVVGFGAAALAQRDRGWFLAPTRLAVAIYVSTGLLATVVLEWYALSQGRWSYGEMMPVVPGLRVGLLPLLQWIILPWPVLFLLRRHHAGAGSAF
jgi:hypothetical protein